MDGKMELPERMFAAGEEPVGIRVTAYGPSCGIRTIMNALEEDERAMIRGSSFGKFVSIADKPAYSGRFGRFLISRQLKVVKKHEIWVLYAGHPIRFSLREFAIVTGLRCGKFPKKSKTKLKNNISETPYWPSLFGNLDSVTVSTVIKMLTRRTVTERVTRVKFACLALLASVLMPTTHHPKIMKEHVEKIKDLEAFFEYPWGRVAFELLICSIKEKNEITLSQNTIAIKGFVHALQLVVVEAVPALLEVTQLNSTSSSESEEDGEKDGPQEKKIMLSPSHARDLHEEEKTIVDCIISDDGEFEVVEQELQWSDDEDDEKVKNIMKLIGEEHEFCSDMFSGGATKADVLRMIKDAKEKTAKMKQKKHVGHVEGCGESSNGEGLVLTGNDLREVVEMVRQKIIDELKGRDKEMLGQMRKALLSLETSIVGGVCENIAKSQTHVMDGCIAEVDKQMKKFKTEVLDGVGLIFNEQVYSKVNKRRERPEVDDLLQRPVILASRLNNQTTSQVTQDNAHFADTVIGSVLAALQQGFSTHKYSGGGEECGNFCNLSEVGDNTAGVDGIEKEVCGDGLNVVGGIGGQLHVNNNQFSLGEANVEARNTTPSFSLALSQKDSVGVGAEERAGGSVVGVLLDVDVGNRGRKSKRQKTLPSSLVGDYQCDIRLIQRAREVVMSAMGYGIDVDYFERYQEIVEKIKGMMTINLHDVSLTSKDFLDIAGRTKNMPPKVMDLLMRHTMHFMGKQGSHRLKKSVFLDTKFVSGLVKHFPKFAKRENKDEYQFQKQFTQELSKDNAAFGQAFRFYFPFNLDKTHWVGICVDSLVSTVYILDSGVGSRSAASIQKELKPVAELFPFLLKHLGRIQVGRGLKPFAVDRLKGVPQTSNHHDSAINAVVIIQAHSIGGAEACFTITPDVLPVEAQRMSIMLFDEFSAGL